jgi:hypothetical protein
MALAITKPVNNFFGNIWIRFAIHVILLTGLILIGQRYWSNFKQKQEINRILTENKTLAASNSVLKIQKDYFESGFYTEKSAKESQWKNIGEKVIDTNNLESTNKNPNESQKYIPSEEKPESNNPQKWISYIFFGDSNKF